MTNYRSRTIPVQGGELQVGVWGDDDAPTVLAIHGITASHRAWSLLAEHAPQLRIIAPDLRGRGRSNALPGPWGMPTHADDAAAVLDAFGVERCTVLGHSMGGFVSANLAMRHPSRVGELLLVDGGLPIPVPAGVSDDDLLTALIGPAAERLAMRFASVEEYRDFWRVHPAFAADWNPTMEQYVDYDLQGDAPELRPSALIDAVAQDSRQLSGDERYAEALAELSIPTQFVRAPRGLLGQIPALYSRELVIEWEARMPQLTTHEAVDVNHYTIVMAEHGVRQVLPIVSGAVARVSAGSGQTTEVSA
ncbi:MULTISPECIES: alpha/beta hydrolase [unclassified Salinibacterium]|uniref:alpha/beta hydrolase n=1 Tax=unclassified Salinibacterium TaxID=2632331 RepID=UPI001CD2E4D3|nr:MULTISPECIES: alpha/beta hydrolase [unclassified Salinibacterium]